MVLRSEHPVGFVFRYIARLATVGLLASASLAGGCIPKRSCEFTRTCPPESDAPSTGLDASSANHSGVDGSPADGSVSPLDAAILIDAAVAPAPVIVCARSADCTTELPFCDDVAKRCTACRADRDCTDAKATSCLLDGTEAQNNRCVECVESANCEDGVCVDDACVACDVDTNEGCDSGKPVCAALDGVPTCVRCEADSDCSADAPKCSGHVCKACSEQDPTHCPANTPVCVEEGSRARCVECADSKHCPLPGAGDTAETLCVQEHCTRCVLGTNDGCTPTAPFCAAAVPEPDDTGVTYLAPSSSATPTANQYIEYEHVCLECVDDGGCGGALPACVQGQCVQCTDNAHCADSPSASLCDIATYTCVGCKAVGDCAHQTKLGTTACDIPNRTCVQCTAAEDTCGGKVCRTVPGDNRFTCSTQNKASAGSCMECFSDSACVAGHNCVRDQYDGQDGSWRCLWRETELDDGAACAEISFFRTAAAATSIDGVEAQYCRPHYTSCEGYLDYYGPDCNSDDDCGISGADDGFCIENTYHNNRCTYRCLTQSDCSDIERGCHPMISVGGEQLVGCGVDLEDTPVVIPPGGLQPD